MRKSKLKLMLGKGYRKVINSIAFYPALIAFGILLFSFATIAVEYQPFMIDIKKHIGMVLVNNQEDARLILSTLIAGLISLTVFSFSMVMLVLNRAASQLSPRVIPGLITSKSNQVVLGSYLGAILYSLILVVSIQSDDLDYYVPEFGVLIAMIMAIYCMALFVYFIHTISQAIHADSILNEIYKATHKIMDAACMEDRSATVDVPDTDEWYSLNAKTVGYLKSIRYDELVHVCQKHDIRVKVREQTGFFSIGNYPYLDVDKEVDLETEKAIHDCVLFYPEDLLSDHYAFGFKQVSEIAVKAMSSGINDPGTAVKAIDMLSVLFLKKMSMIERNCYFDSDGHPRLFVPVYPMERLLYDNLTPIRAYAKQDAVVMYNLLESLRNLLAAGEGEEYRPLLCTYVESMRDSIQENINNPLDIDMINRMISQINRYLAAERRLELIDSGRH